MIPIYKILSQSAALRAVVNTEIQLYEQVALEGTKPPYIVWQVISSQADNNLDCAADTDNHQYQLMVWATTIKQAQEIKAIARKALENRSWVLNPHISEYDQSTRLYGRGFDANYINQRNT